MQAITPLYPSHRIPVTSVKLGDKLYSRLEVKSVVVTEIDGSTFKVDGKPMPIPMVLIGRSYLTKEQATAPLA